MLYLWGHPLLSSPSRRVTPQRPYLFFLGEGSLTRWGKPGNHRILTCPCDSHLPLAAIRTHPLIAECLLYDSGTQSLRIARSRTQTSRQTMKHSVHSAGTKVNRITGNLGNIQLSPLPVRPTVSSAGEEGTRGWIPGQTSLSSLMHMDWTLAHRQRLAICELPTFNN